MRPHLPIILACLVGALPATAADELPKRKAGLWEIKVVGGREAPLRSIRQCVDAETDTLMMTSFTDLIGRKCDKPEIRTGGGAITVDATCTIGSATRTTRAVITGDFDSAYTIAVSLAPAGAVAPASNGSGAQPITTVEAKWLGPCAEGQRPGDIILPGGIKLNVRSFGIDAGALPRP
jgi:hypothetical protein